MDENKDRLLLIKVIVFLCVLVTMGILLYKGVSGEWVDGQVSTLSELPQYAQEFKDLEISGPAYYTFITTYRGGVLGVISGKVVSQERLDAYVKEKGLLWLDKYKDWKVVFEHYFEDYLRKNKDQYNTTFALTDIVYKPEAAEGFAPFSTFLFAYRSSDNAFSIIFQVDSDQDK